MQAVCTYFCVVDPSVGDCSVVKLKFVGSVTSAAVVDSLKTVVWDKHPTSDSIAV